MSIKIFEYGPEGAPTILFLHGLGVSSWMWQEQIAALQETYRCLAVDLPGNGDSYQTEWHSFGETAVSLAEIIRQRASGGRAHVVGLSLGGYSALRLLADFPDLVLSTIVSGVTTRPFPNQPHYKLLPAILSRILGWSVVINLTAKMMQLPEDVKPLYRQDNRRLSSQTIKRIYAEVFNFHLPSAGLLHGSRLLAVAGEKEASLVLEGLANFREGGTAVTAIVPQAHHGWNAEFPDLFTEMVESWIEERTLPERLQEREFALA